MFGPMAWHFLRRHLHATHGHAGPRWHAGPGSPHGSPWGQRGPQWGAWAHGGFGGYGHHHHGPSREEEIAHLEQYQRDLEEETIAVAARIKELRAAAAGTPRGTAI